MAVAAAKSLFSKSMQDMVKGIRQAKDDPHEFIQSCIAECKAELKGRDVGLKCQALAKLTYVRSSGRPFRRVRRGCRRRPSSRPRPSARGAGSAAMSWFRIVLVELGLAAPRSPRLGADAAPPCPGSLQGRPGLAAGGRRRAGRR